MGAHLTTVSLGRVEKCCILPRASGISVDLIPRYPHTCSSDTKQDKEFEVFQILLNCNSSQ